MKVKCQGVVMLARVGYEARDFLLFLVGKTRRIENFLTQCMFRKSIAAGSSLRYHWRCEATC